MGLEDLTYGRNIRIKSLLRTAGMAAIIGLGAYLLVSCPQKKEYMGVESNYSVGRVQQEAYAD